MRPIDVLGERQVMCGDFDEGADYGIVRPHGADSWLLFLTRAGAGRIAWPGGAHRTVPGEAVICQAGTRHDYRTDPATGRWAFRWAHFRVRPEIEPHLGWPALAPGLRRVQVADPGLRAWLWRRMGEAVRWGSALRPRGRDLALLAVEEVLLRLADCAPPASGRRLDPRLEAVLERVAGDLAAPWDVAAMAAACAMSPSRFAHLFRGQFGTTPRRWIEDRRLARALELLRATGLSVASVAAQVGFPDPFHFTARVKARTGRPPTAWRPRVAGGGPVA